MSDTIVESAPPDARPVARWISGPRLATAAVLVIAIAFAALAASSRSQLVAERSELVDIERAATAVTLDLLTYDFRDLDAWRDRVLRHATPGYRATFIETEPQLRAAVAEAAAASTAKVTGVFVGSVDEDRASVVVTADSVVTTTEGERATRDAYLRLDLLRIDSAWRVENVTNVNLGSPGNG